MKLTVVLPFLLLAACEKSSNLPAMEEEATSMVESYKLRFDRLVQRRTLIDARSKRIPPDRIQRAEDFAGLRAVATEANNQLAQMQTLLRTAPEQIAAAAHPADPANAEDPRIALVKKSSELEGKLRAGYLTLVRDLDTVEAWIDRLETTPQVVAQAEPAPEPEPEPEPAASEPEPEQPAPPPPPPPPPAPAPTPAPAPAR